MARRPSTENYPDPFDDEFQDLDDSNVGKMRLEDSKIEDIDYDDLVEPTGLSGEVTREPVTVGQYIGGALQVIVQAVLILVVFLAIGFGVVFAGQRIGIVPQRAASVAAPNLGINIGIVPTSEPTDIPPTAIPPTPTLAPGEIIDCPSAVTWWNSQQVQDNFTYFTQTALTEARSANFVSGLVTNLNVRRSFLANLPADPCMIESRDTLLRAFDATIAAIGAIGRNDTADIDAQLANANAAYDDLREELAKVGVTAEMPAIS
jgi:hypothetical protein